ncbi:LacI family transcriptional regulator [Burkholderia plantarii]|nr:LacI family transcriptional regulator [Burkholderia plantarii]
MSANHDSLPEPGAPVRMADVARLAGVSKMSVSRVLTGQHVSDVTRERVMDAVRRTGYVADAVAGALSSGRNNVIAVVVPSLSSSNFADTVRGINDVVETRNLRLLLANTDYIAEREESLIRSLLSHQPRGIVVTGGHHTPEARAMLEQAGIPVIETWELPGRPIDRVVGFSNEDAAQAMTRYLYERGYRRIGFIGSSSLLDLRGIARRNGYLAAVEQAGLHAPRDVVRPTPANDMAHGAAMGHSSAALNQLLAEWPDTDAVMCTSDIHAFGAIMACHRLGLTVPGDLAVAGFGDFEVSRHCYPTITTISVDAYGIGHSTGQSLLAAIDGSERPNVSRREIASVQAQRQQHDAPPLIRIPYEVVARESA